MGNYRSRVLVAALAGLAVGWLAYTELYVPSGGRPVSYWTAAIGRLQLPRAETEVFRTHAEYRDFIEQRNVAVDAPHIDLGRNVAVLIALGPRSSAGSGVRIVSVEEQRGRMLVVAREDYRPGLPATVSYPSVVVVFREKGKPVAVQWDD